MTKPRLSYANVTATLALVVCLSGTAVAATTINGSEIQNRSIAHTKLIRNTLTGAEIHESTLGKVPNSAAVSGNKVVTIRANVPNTADGWSPVYFAPGVGPIEVNCSANGNGFTLRVTNNVTGQPIHYSYAKSAEAPGGGNSKTAGNRIAAGASIEVGITNTSSDNGFEIDLKVLGYHLKHGLDLSVGGLTDAGGTSHCIYTATAIAR